MDNIQVSIDDLVLKVSQNVNREVWNESKYYNFIDNLCQNREYQKEAIWTVLRYLLSGEYDNLEQLAEENFNSNADLRNVYNGEFNQFKKGLHFPDKLSCSLDLATGTGKSYVLFALAVIMLAENKVDQVLLLVPSVTIEQELTKKFKDLSSSKELVGQIKAVGGQAPRIINGSESIVAGSICIENRDAIYKNARTSIADSLSGKGERTLLLNDEVHHVYNTDGNKWKNFIKDYDQHEINFKYLVGVSGTCYLGNDYFSDVVYRYSIRQAIEDRFVKSVEYIAEDDINDRREGDRWNTIFESHQAIARNLPSRFSEKPISIIVTKDIKTCKAEADKFNELLKSRNNFTDDEVKQKVLVVHSQADAATDRLKLKDVDKPGNQVEWIFSVSMLTEGWDVKRVFQIIPHEKRAFESKLLIAQVMGRGLRVPENWKYEWGQPKVRIFNHSNWASSIKGLVNEVLEFEEKLPSRIIPDSEYNFSLTNVEYKMDKNTKETKAEDPYKFLEKGFVTLASVTKEVHHELTYENIVDGSRISEQYEYTGNTWSADEIARLMYSRFGDLDSDIKDRDGKTLEEHYKEKWPVEKLGEMINLSLEKYGNNVITDDLKAKFLTSMGTLFRTGNKSVSYKFEPDKFTEVETQNMRQVSVSKSSLRNRSKIFYSGNTNNYLEINEQGLLQEVSDPDGEFRGAGVQITNIHDFKTPQFSVIADSTPEVKFVRMLTNKTNNAKVDKWVKAANTSFYSLEYTWRKGEHPMRNSFNPDFFLLVGNRIIVAEVKGDEQIANPDPENIGKWRAAIKHFKVINEHVATGCKEHGELDVENLQYKFTMITPQSYNTFFERVNSGKVDQIDSFTSYLDSTIKGRNE
jgi:type III restriction enzyme